MNAESDKVLRTEWLSEEECQRASPTILHLSYFVSWLWWRALRRRSQKTRLTWERMRRLVARYLPLARITHLYPSVRFRLGT